MHYNLRKHFFSNRIFAVWDSLVACAVSILFQIRFNKF